MPTVFAVSSTGRKIVSKIRFFFFAMLALSLILMQGCAGRGHRRSYHSQDPRPLTTCFYNFTETYQDRIYPALSEAPGVTSIKRSWASCKAQQPCLCYTLTYDGPIDELSAWLNQRLPVNKAIPFRCVAKDSNHLEIIFDSGFK